MKEIGIDTEYLYEKIGMNCESQVPTICFTSASS